MKGILHGPMIDALKCEVWHCNGLWSPNDKTLKWKPSNEFRARRHVRTQRHRPSHTHAHTHTVTETWNTKGSEPFSLREVGGFGGSGWGRENIFKFNYLFIFVWSYFLAGRNCWDLATRWKPTQHVTIAESCHSAPPTAYGDRQPSSATFTTRPGMMSYSLPCYSLLHPKILPSTQLRGAELSPDVTVKAIVKEKKKWY